MLASVFSGIRQGNLTAMYYNVYGWTAAGPIPLRHQNQLTLIKAYRPDFLGVQEYSPAFRSDFTPLMEALGYALVRGSEDILFTPILYRTETLELLDCDGVIYPEKTVIDGTEYETNDLVSKTLVLAVFRHKATGKCFIAANTHFMWSSPALGEELGNVVREQNARMALDAIRAFRKKDASYASLPLLFGGDLNGFPSSPAIKLLKSEGLCWAYEVPGAERDHSCGMKPYPLYDNERAAYVDHISPPPEGQEASIDYIFIGAPSNDLTLHGYYTVTDEEALKSSDHCPRLATLSLY